MSNYFGGMEWYERPDLAALITIANGIVLDDSSKINKIALITTSALVLDSFVTPWLTEGRTLHQFLGLSAGDSIDLKILLCERGAAAIGNFYMALRNAAQYASLIK